MANLTLAFRFPGLITLRWDNKNICAKIKKFLKISELKYPSPKYLWQNICAIIYTTCYMPYAKCNWDSIAIGIWHRYWVSISMARDLIGTVFAQISCQRELHAKTTCRKFHAKSYWDLISFGMEFSFKYVPCKCHAKAYWHDNCMVFYAKQIVCQSFNWDWDSVTIPSNLYAKNRNNNKFISSKLYAKN